MISKKELLKVMNISYGQLYRWKREGLIPDEWFIKQAVSTGQETFFKKDLIIPRIEKILSLKDDYQLDEIKKLFNQEVESSNYSAREAVMISEIDPYILKAYLKDRKDISISELAIIYLFSKHQDKISIQNNLNINLQEIDNNHIMYIYKADDNYLLIIGDDKLIVDKKMILVVKENIENAISYIAKKLKED